MSAPGTINHDTASRLIGVTPGELEALVKSGAVRRQARDAYALPVLVQDYIGHLKAERERAELAPKQAEIAEHLDMSDRAVREFLDAAAIDQRAVTLTDIRLAYIRRQREVAAGRMAFGDLDLATERARLAKEQADRIALQNAITRREYAPTMIIEEVLTRTAARINVIFEALTGSLRRNFPDLTAEKIDHINREIAKARNLVAEIRLIQVLDEDEAPPDEIVDTGVDEQIIEA